VPDAEWRLIVALARYGGLRTPSETLALEWLHVDWEQGRVTIHAPKQEHLANGGVRQIPLFPELRPYLEEAFELAAEGSRFVITRYGDGDTNLRTHFQRIIRKAGVKPWGRLFHHLRGSRQTELTERFPAHVVSAWLGNTPRVAVQHYLQVRDSDFERAAKSEAVALQKCTSQTAEANGDQTQLSQIAKETLEFLDNLRQLAAISNYSHYPRQESHNPRKTLGIPQKGRGALQKALHFLPSLSEADRDLAQLIASLSQIPESARQSFRDLLSNQQLPR
jgi:hypothetical protein